MAFFLTIAMIAMIQDPDSSWLIFIPKFFGGMLIGAIGGFIFGKISVILINRIKLDIDGLYPVMAMALMFMTYTITDLATGNGFLAVYVMGLILGNSTIVHKRSLMKFFDGISWLMQIVMFLTLGLLVFPSQMIKVAIPGVMISLFLILIARPIAVGLCTLPWKMQFRDRLFLSWCGLRGAVPIIFATYPLVAGIPQSRTIFNVVFFISLTSLLLQGSTIFGCARLLGLVVPAKLKPHYFVHLADTYRSELREVVVTTNSHVAGKQILEIKIPDSILVVLIDRNGRFFSPRGNTRLETNDKLYVIAENPKQVEEFAKYVAIHS
jgi:cell volume regulation protein A